MDELKQTVDYLTTLNDENLAWAVIHRNDVQWCLGELQNLLNQYQQKAEPPVRCKNCKFSHADEHGRTCEGYWFSLSEFAVAVQDDDFCSRGKALPQPNSK